jgi:Flp pilus assembly protein TadD
MSTDPPSPAQAPVRPSAPERVCGLRGTWRPLLLAAAGVIVYANSLSVPFVFDDLRNVHPRLIGQLWPPSAAFGESARPIANLTLAVDYAIGGLDATGYHATNIAIHVLAALALFGVVRRTLATPALRQRFGHTADSLAFAAALLWITHPLQTEAVSYVTQRAESLMALFYLLTLYAVIRSASSVRSLLWASVAVACCALGMATKQVMVTAPLVVLLYDRTFLAGSFASALRERLGLHLCLAATWTLLVVLFDWGAIAGPNRFAGPDVVGVSMFEYARSQPEIILHYLRLVVWPHPLILYYRWPVAHDTARIFFSTGVLAALGLAVLWELRRATAVGFLGASFFLILAPTSSVMPIVDLAFEHRMYLALAPVLLLGVATGQAVLARLAAPRWVGAVVLFALAAAFATTTMLRNWDYRSHESLWRTVAAGAPENPRGHMNLGIALTRLGRSEEGLLPLRRALALDGQDAEIHNNLGVALGSLGRSDDAIRHFRLALESSPDYAKPHSNLGLLLHQRGRLTESLPYLARAVELAPDDPIIRANHANTLLRLGRFDEGLAELRASLRLDPNNVVPLIATAWTLAKHPDPDVRDPDEAVLLADHASELSDRVDPSLLMMLADAYAAAGQPAQAEATADTAETRARAMGANALANRIRARRAEYQLSR